MPYIEVYDFAANVEQRRAATQEITDSLCAAYGISKDIVTLFFQRVEPDGYGHGGRFGAAAEAQRIFIKIHAYPRFDQMRRLAADAVTQAVVRAYGVPAEAIALYFIERPPSQVAHAGVLAGD
ncbi:tautomerase family protein [Pseudomonas mangiferae]|nr:tautomerase family protein [Pseudomonas mangiferae]